MAGEKSGVRSCGTQGWFGSMDDPLGPVGTIGVVPVGEEPPALPVAVGPPTVPPALVAAASEAIWSAEPDPATGGAELAE